MNFDEICELAKTKKVGQQTLGDFPVFTTSTNELIMNNELQKSINARRKSERDKFIIHEYEVYQIKFVDFEIATFSKDEYGREVSSLGEVHYNNGAKYPTVCICNGYRYSDNAVSYFALGFKGHKTPEMLAAICAGKLLGILEMEEGETEESISNMLGLDANFNKNNKNNKG